MHVLNSSFKRKPQEHHYCKTEYIVSLDDRAFQYSLAHWHCDDFLPPFIKSEWGVHSAASLICLEIMNSRYTTESDIREERLASKPK